MSPVTALKGMSDLAQLGALMLSVGVGAAGIGLAWGKQPDLQPVVRQHGVAIDSLRLQTRDAENRLDEMDDKLDRVLCYLETQASGANQIRCAR